MTKPLYPGTQEELYLTCTAGGTSYTQYFTDFSAFSPSYKAEWPIDMGLLVTAARQMPDRAAREAAAELKRIDLVNVVLVATGLWQTLKRYIIKVYKNAGQAVTDIKLAAAGQAYYEKATNEHWQSAIALMVNGSNFIVANENDLQPGVITPLTFQQTFDDAKAACETALGEYVQLTEKIDEDVEKKIVANNACYVKLIEMFKDGQDIFEDEPEIKKQFVYEEVAKKVGGIPDTGLKGLIRNEAEMPLEGVIVRTTIGGHQTMSTEDGHYHIAQIAADTYTVEFILDGYETLVMEIELETSVTKHVNVTMKAVAPVTV